MADAIARQVLRGSIVRPVDDQRFADNILARNQPPVPAVEGVVAIVPPRAIVARPNDKFPLPHIVLDHLEPPRMDFSERWGGRKVVTVRESTRVDVLDVRL